MTNAETIRFTLIDCTEVIVKKVTNNKYDFELKLPNGNRKLLCGLLRCLN